MTAALAGLDVAHVWAHVSATGWDAAAGAVAEVALVPDLPWVATALVPLLLVGWYLSFSAARLDRLHHRIETARQALAGALLRRAVAGQGLTAFLDGAAGPVDRAARAAMTAAGEGAALTGPGLDGVGIDRVETAENALTRALVEALPDADRVVAVRARNGAEALDALADACTRVQLARRIHNDAVSQAQRVRRKRVVRWSRLSGRAPMPRMVELDDSLPPGLGG